jgi:hypothetical protein
VRLTVSDDDTRQRRQYKILDEQERDARNRRIDYNTRKNNIEAEKRRKRQEKIRNKRAS